MPTLSLRDFMEQGVDGAEAMKRLLNLRYGTVSKWARQKRLNRDHVYGTLNQSRTGENVRDALAQEFGETREYIDSLLMLEPVATST
jgi:hypothetical protein